jgi:signal transduction histidine kinase
MPAASDAHRLPLIWSICRHPFISIGLYNITLPAILLMLCRCANHARGHTRHMTALGTLFIVARAVAQIPALSWPHRAFWYLLSCAPLPELNWSLSRIIGALAESLPKESATSQAALRLIRLLAMLSVQGLAVVPLAAADGVLSPGAIDAVACAADVVMLLLLPNAICEAQSLVTRELLDHQEREVQKCQKYNDIKQLMLSLERKNRFLSVITHELRTPLHCIIAMTHEVDAQISGEPLHSQHTVHTVRTIKLSGRRLLQLINGLLDAAHLRKAPLLLRFALQSPVLLGGSWPCSVSVAR